MAGRSGLPSWLARKTATHYLTHQKGQVLAEPKILKAGSRVRMHCSVCINARTAAAAARRALARAHGTRVELSRTLQLY